MNALRRADLVRTLEESGGQVISIYMPVRSGAESRQNPVRLKNLLRDAEAQLGRRQADSAEVPQMLAPAWELVESGDLSGQVGKGLAVMLGPAGMRVWQLPFECEERCVVGRNFYVLPLLAWLNNDAPYYVLAVSQNQVRLLRGTRGDIEEIEVPGMPPNLEEALQLDVPEPVQQAHVSRPRTPGKGDLTFHGHGGAPDAAPAEIESFLREIDRAVAKFLRLQTEPLIFAGVDYLFPMYRQVNNYPHLLATPITGNPELWPDAEFRERAWPRVADALRVARKTAVEKYGNLISHGRATNRLEDILAAAHAGAVETLFVDPSVERRGTFSPETSAVRVGESEDGESEDLANLAATLVLSSSGSVETPESGNVPGGGAMAAVLRYQFPPPAAQAKAASAARS